MRPPVFGLRALEQESLASALRRQPIMRVYIHSRLW